MTAAYAPSPPFHVASAGWKAPESSFYRAVDSESLTGLSDDLHASAQTIVSLLDSAYWCAVCPWLHCSRDTDSENTAALALSLSAPTPAAPADPIFDLPLAAVITLATSQLPGNAASGPSAPSPRADTHIANGAEIAPAPPAIDVESCRARMLSNGFFRVDAAALAHAPGLARSLEAGVLRLVSLGHSPCAIQNYDEAWTMAESCVPICEAATGNSPNGDWFSFLVSPNVHQFSGPHRDKPAAGPSSFRRVGTPGAASTVMSSATSATSPSPSLFVGDSAALPSEKRVPGSVVVDGSAGAPMYCTAWIALSDASPENSCLYFLPADRDPGYLMAGDAIREALPGPAAWGNIVAQPCASGGMLVFSHRLLHWGSAAEKDAPPRVAMSFALADASFETGPYFDAKRFLPYPPLALRVSLRAGQAIAYNAQAPLSRAQLALDNRVFMAGKRFFSDGYVDKIAGAAQQIKFDHRAQQQTHNAAAAKQPRSK